LDKIYVKKDELVQFLVQILKKLLDVMSKVDTTWHKFLIRPDPYPQHCIKMKKSETGYRRTDVSDLVMVLASFSVVDVDSLGLLDTHTMKSVLRINDILVRIWIRGSMPLTNGSGFGSGSKFYCVLLFEGTFTSVSKIKSKRSHNAVGIRVFLTIFVW
jgi:hypothetical protein